MNVYIGGAKDYSAMRGPCAEGYHVPQLSEWEGIKEIMDGLGLSTGAERKNKLHMPLSGYRQGSDAKHIHDEAFGYYATNSIYNASYPDLTKCLLLSVGTITVGSGRKRSDGLSIRGFYNSFVIPTSSWTIIQGTLGSAGIFRDTVNGLISITLDGTTGYTIQDKNLGATTVYSDGDTLSEANCGKFYQWGNNYGFAWTGSVTTSSTQVDASAYGPGNYYNSSTFITGNNDWSSVHNDNLRGGETGIISPAELKNAYIGEVWTPGSNTVGYWTFDDRNANQITDVSGNGNNLIGDTMPAYIQVLGSNYAGNYNNVSSGGTPYYYGTIDSNKFTVMLWLKVLATGQQYITNMINGSIGNLPALIYGYNSGQIELYSYQSGNTYRSTIKSSTVLDTWYCVGFTRNGTTMKTYLNGAYVSSLTVPVATGLTLFHLGSTGTSTRFHGQIGEAVLESGVEEDLSYMSNYYNLTKSNYGL